MPIHWETIKEGRINEAYVKGVAISATTSRNNVTYLVEELEQSYPTLNGKNISIGHDDDPSNNVGLIESVNFDGKNVNYFAKVYNTSTFPDAVERIKNKLFQFVSIEAIVPKLEKVEDKVIAKGINFTGLSFVRTPGIEGASAALADESFANAIFESFNFNIEGEKDMEIAELKDLIHEEMKVLKEEITEELKSEKSKSEAVVSDYTETTKPTIVESYNERNTDLKIMRQEVNPGDLVVEGFRSGNVSFWVMPDADGKLRKAV